MRVPSGVRPQTKSSVENGVPGGIRTPELLVRRQIYRNATERQKSPITDRKTTYDFFEATRIATECHKKTQNSRKCYTKCYAFCVREFNLSEFDNR